MMIISMFFDRTVNIDKIEFFFDQMYLSKLVKNDQRKKLSQVMSNKISVK